MTAARARLNVFDLIRLALPALSALAVVATGVMQVEGQESPASIAPEDLLQPARMLPDIPVGLTSFGAANCGNALYVYGGHIGEAHDYDRESQSGITWRLDLENPREWESVDESAGRQGLAMVAHGGKIYRIGGFEAHNEPGTEQSLHSVDTCEVFDPSVGKWSTLAPMPVPRSSFDAVVVGDVLYVIGGWVMAGDEETRWLESACSIDLSNLAAGWEEMPQPPFARRALSTGFQGEKIYVIGGMQEKGGPTRRVDVFDITRGTWSDGPELPGEEAMEGFGNSCFNIGGRLVVSTYGGNFHTLNEAGDAWEPMGSIEPGRFFHRLVPIGENQFALLGGANMGSGKTMETPVFKR